MFYVYVLRSWTTGELYTGSTSDLTRRIAEHNEGASRSTKHARPWELVHEEEFFTRTEGVRREHLESAAADLLSRGSGVPHRGGPPGAPLRLTLRRVRWLLSSPLI